MTKNKYLHIFDKNLVYGSESGNYFEKCKDCAIQLVVYVADSRIVPIRVKQHELIRGTNSEFLKADGILVEYGSFNDFLVGKPNIAITYHNCI